jgi:hypothetical protein
MALLLLAPGNIEYAKSAMRDAFPHVKATHRAEALAAALGFRTYASLLAAVGAAEAQFLARAIEPAKFSARLSGLGYDGVAAEPLIRIVRSATMPFRPWTEFKKGDLQANNRWFYECQRRDIPLITLETRVRYVALNWDCISRDPKYDTHLGEDRGALLVREMFAAFQSLARHSPGKAMFQGSSFVGSVDSLMPDIARNLADAFYMMLIPPSARGMAA